jgi:hypothetical protein
MATRHDEVVKAFGKPSSRSCTNRALHAALNAAARIKFQTGNQLMVVGRVATRDSCTLTKLPLARRAELLHSEKFDIRRFDRKI